MDGLLPIVNDVLLEVSRAISLHKTPIHNAHEAHSVIGEEFEEFWDEVKAHNLPKGRDRRKEMREELIQCAAMCARSIYDLKLGGVDAEG